MKISVDVLMMFIRDVSTVRQFVNCELGKQENPDQMIATAMTRIDDFSKSLGKTEVKVIA